MNNSHPRILEDVLALLRGDVVPALADPNLRAQVYSAIYMLENLRLRIDWASEPARSQVEAQDAFFDTLRRPGALDGDALALLPAAERARGAADFMALRDAGDAVIARLIAEGRIGAESQAALKACLTLQVEAEMRHTARAMFAEMSSGEAPVG